MQKHYAPSCAGMAKDGLGAGGGPGGIPSPKRPAVHKLNFVDAEDERMASLYRQHVLKEEAPQESGVMQIQGLGGKKKPEPVSMS